MTFKRRRRPFKSLTATSCNQERKREMGRERRKNERKQKEKQKNEEA